MLSLLVYFHLVLDIAIVKGNASVGTVTDFDGNFSIDVPSENSSLVFTYVPMLDGERFMTDKELCARLQLSRRTLQDYRNNGVIPYIQLGGKILYRESDIQKILMANYREAYRMKGV